MNQKMGEENASQFTVIDVNLNDSSQKTLITHDKTISVDDIKLERKKIAKKKGKKRFKQRFYDMDNDKDVEENGPRV